MNHAPHLSAIERWRVLLNRMLQLSKILTGLFVDVAINVLTTWPSLLVYTGRRIL
jgi:hypothetical protein